LVKTQALTQKTLSILLHKKKKNGYFCYLKHN
jgi:hypothetical protein